MNNVEGAAGKLPVVRALEFMDNDHVRLELAAPVELAWFNGHFPDHPVLPGVAQVGWAIRFAREAFAFDSDPLHIERVRFQRPIMPGSELVLELSRNGEHPDRIGWRFVQGEASFSRGSLDFAAGP